MTCVIFLMNNYIMNCIGTYGNSNNEKAVDGLKDELDDLRTLVENEIAMRQNVTKDNDERLENIEKEIGKSLKLGLSLRRDIDRIIFSLMKKFGDDTWEFWNTD